MAKEISALELRKHFGEVVEQVRYRKEPHIVTRNGRPMIVLIDIDAYQASEAQHREEAFIEEYTAERVKELLQADTVGAETRKHIKQLLA